MIKILFVCYGNICRSPMAEFILKDMVKRRSIADKFLIESAATSSEEIGNPVYYLAKEKLASKGISCRGKQAVQLRRDDYERYDYIIGMESMNVRSILRITGKDAKGKVCRLLDFTDSPRDIADPWYTRNFDITYDEIVEGCEALLEKHDFGFNTVGCK